MVVTGVTAVMATGRLRFCESFPGAGRWGPVARFPAPRWGAGGGAALLAQAAHVSAQLTVASR